MLGAVDSLPVQLSRLSRLHCFRASKTGNLEQLVAPAAARPPHTHTSLLLAFALALPCVFLSLTWIWPPKVTASHPGLVWDRTKAWVTSAAEVAPLTTEALLHCFLTSSDSLPGATSLEWQSGGTVANALSSSAVAGTLGGGRQARGATQAAYRRAADLLQACAAARRRGQLFATGAADVDAGSCTRRCSSTTS